MARRERLVFLGMLSYTPYAGIAWQALQYLEGFRRLGYDVYYVDDTSSWPVDEFGNVTDDPSFFLNYISRLMSRYGLQERWAWRLGESGPVFGLSESALNDLFHDADLLINLSGATKLRSEHLRIPIRVYLETDPFQTEIEIARGNEAAIEIVNAHTHFFTFGENIGTAYCAIPTSGIDYKPTRQPAILDWWKSPSDSPTAPRTRMAFRTITSWQQTNKDIEWDGTKYLWSKHEEFLKFIDLPLRSDCSFEVAIASHDSSVISLLEDNKWGVVDAVALTTNDVDRYRSYVMDSRGEFTVAKDQYVRPNTGWFSDRSATYLAAGRPVITQATGFDRILPTGKGLFGFRTMDDVLAAVEEIERDYDRSCQAALEVAIEFFSGEKVLKSMMDRI